MKPKIRVQIDRGTWLEFPYGTSKRDIKQRVASFKAAYARKYYYKKEIHL